MSEAQELDSESFNSNYQVLKKTADWLSSQKEPDIDQLVPKVETAMKAYKICKSRLDTVQATLGQFFDQDGLSGEEPSRRDANGNEHAHKPRQSTSPPADDRTSS
jgi:exodeoxyribonuclease VII small subunit